jgi:ectoine hydroxylase-related dioxygenase (phytanoyl-CoA dioxygenase family)
MWRLRRSRSHSGADAALRDHWESFGFAILPAFFSDPQVGTIEELIERQWQERHRPENPVVIDVLDGPLRDRRMYFRDVPDDAKNYPYKLNDLYLVEPEVREFVLDTRLVVILRDLIGGDPAVCNSLNFERGSQQQYHFDTYYMPGPCTGGLVVTSICLEDVHPDAGPLTYYPGSHRILPYRFSHGGVHAVPEEMDAATAYAREQLLERSLVEEEFHGRKGDVFIWHEQLYHGGRPIRDPGLTRKSLVTHYWRADALKLDPGWEMRSIGRHRYWLHRHHQPVPQPY